VRSFSSGEGFELIVGAGPQERNIATAVWRDPTRRQSPSTLHALGAYDDQGDLQYDELCVRVTGPVVAQFAAVFATDWYSETGELLRPEAYLELLQEGWQATGSSLCQVLPSGPGFEDENNLRLFTGLIHAAKRRLIIVNPYFVPDEALMLAITTAALQGVRVTLINSETSDQMFVSSAQRSYYERLLLAGVEVLLYHKPVMLHSKSIAVDDEIAVIGSSNLDIRSFTLNLEVSLVVYDQVVVQALLAVFDSYIARSKPVELTEWRQRSAGAKLMENIARLTAALQ
jgi:cardiolipin synthase A/B